MQKSLIRQLILHACKPDKMIKNGRVGMLLHYHPTTSLVLLLNIINSMHNECKNNQYLSSTRNTEEIRCNQKRCRSLEIPVKTYRTNGLIDMKFDFKIIGHAESEDGVLLTECLQDMIDTYNTRSGNPLDNWHVLVREDDSPHWTEIEEVVIK